MIPLKIGKQKYNIKSITELNTREFIQLNRLEGELNAISYIAWQTGRDLKEVFVWKVDPVIIKQIGKIPDMTAVHRPRYLLGRRVKDHKIETIGQRFMIESETRFKGYDLLVFVAAVALTRSSNIDEIETCMDHLYDISFLQVIPAANFFFRILQSGSNKGQNCFSKLRSLIKTRKLKKVRA